MRRANARKLGRSNRRTLWKRFWVVSGMFVLDLVAAALGGASEGITGNIFGGASHVSEPAPTVSITLPHTSTPPKPIPPRPTPPRPRPAVSPAGPPAPTATPSPSTTAPAPTVTRTVAPPIPLGECRDEGFLQSEHAPVQLQPCVLAVRDGIQVTTQIIATAPGSTTIFVWLYNYEGKYPLEDTLHRCPLVFTSVGEVGQCGPFVSRPDRPGKYMASTSATTDGNNHPSEWDNQKRGIQTSSVPWP